MNAGNKNTPSTSPSTKTECDYLNGWIKKRSHTQKISPKSGEPQRYSWGTQKKKKKKKRKQEVISSQTPTNTLSASHSRLAGKADDVGDAQSGRFWQIFGHSLESFSLCFCSILSQLTLGRSSARSKRCALKPGCCFFLIQRATWTRCNKPKSLYATNTTIVILATLKTLSVVFIAHAFTPKTLFLATPMTLSSSKKLLFKYNVC